MQQSNGLKTDTRKNLYLMYSSFTIISNIPLTRSQKWWYYNELLQSDLQTRKTHDCFEHMVSQQKRILYNSFSRTWKSHFKDTYISSYFNQIISLQERAITRPSLQGNNSLKYLPTERRKSYGKKYRY